MKRILSVFLLFATLLTSLTILSATAAVEEGLRIVSTGCSYTSSKPYTTDANKYTDNYRNKKMNELTDGKYGTSTVGAEWYGFNGASTYEIVVDLGKTYSDLARVQVQFGKQDSWGIVLPAAVKAFGSVDGKNFTMLGTLTDTTGGTGVNHDYAVDISGEYRYIRIEITSAGAFAFVSEVDVLCGYVDTLSFPKGNAFLAHLYIFALHTSLHFCHR